MFAFKDYWPQPKVGELRVFDFGYGADNKRYSFIVWNSGDDRHFYQEDYHDNKWTSTWVMDYLGVRGVTETADIYPKRSYQFWTKYRTTAFVPGKEIIWGGLAEVGHEFNATIQIDPIASTKFEAPTYGKQRVKFCNKYDNFNGHNDVIEIEYDQSFGDGKAAGWRAWHAKGVGIIQINWRYDGKDVGSPYKAAINDLKGKIVDKYPVLTY